MRRIPFLSLFLLLLFSSGNLFPDGETDTDVLGSWGDAENNAMNNLALMLNNGIQPQFTPNMNLKKHLEIYKQERMRWTGYEDQNQNIGLLDNAIAQLEQMVGQQGAQGQLGQQGVATESVVQGQETAGVLGGI